MACSAQRRSRRHSAVGTGATGATGATAAGSAERSTDAGEQVVRVVGALDLGEVTRLRQQLAGVSGAASIRLDLSGVTFIDSVGLAALLDTIDARRALGQRTSIIATSRPVRLVLEILGLTESLTRD